MGCGSSSDSKVVTNKPISYGPPPPYQSPSPNPTHVETQQPQHLSVKDNSQNEALPDKDSEFESSQNKSSQNENGNTSELEVVDVNPGINVQHEISLFVEYQEKINELENKNVEEMFLVHTMEYETVKVALEKKRAEYDLLYSQMLEKRNNNDIVNVKFATTNFVVDGSTLQQEELQYLEIKNKVDICKNQLDCLIKQEEELQAVLETEKQESNNLIDLKEKQDLLLESMFNGEYGSELEGWLELHVEQYFIYKQHLSFVYSKWRYARQLFYNACWQISYAYRRWMQIETIPQNFPQAKYYLATDTRNHLIAADQNCRKAAEFISMNSMPYWSFEDFKNIVININTIYNDVMIKENFNRALLWFKYYHYRLAVQLQWTDNVINTKLTADYHQAVQVYKQKYQELRMERIRCLQEIAHKWSLNIDFKFLEKCNSDENHQENVSVQISAPITMPSNQESSLAVPDIDIVEEDLSDFNSIMNDNIAEYIKDEDKNKFENIENRVNENITNENTAIENTAIENTAIENTANENAGNENLVNENAANENAANENAADENAANENAANENGANENAANENAVNENTSNENVANENTEEKSTTNEYTAHDNLEFEKNDIDSSQIKTEEGMTNLEVEKIPNNYINDQNKDSFNNAEILDAKAPAPPALKYIPLSELAPVPSDIELFGNIQDLQEKHKHEVEEFEKAQANNKAKQLDDLQRKLKRRKTQRRMLLQQNKEVNDLLSGV
ncbi:dynein heavy chain-like protein 2 isoform X2 [Hydra vulgaris]|uniref:dynein heavy chain-like protein 2 isoform X2 n=1 Tax=Hydra vulgaris TaxID=6087 RepID=UPI001F5EAF52|nr:dynein heavy chain-like protein PF11_0240 isoform X2 [Hydra vulgaris]